MTEHCSPYVWPRPAEKPKIWTGFLVLLARSRWGRHYVLSRDIGVRRRFILRLREWAEQMDVADPRHEVIQMMVREERRDLVLVIAKREDLWR